jgi:hypothetical protein
MGSKSYSKGISWIDDCRIPFVDEKVVSKKYNDGYDTFTTYLDLGSVKTDYNVETNTTGRFPANLLVSDDMLNDGVISKSGDIKPHIQKRKTNVFNSNQVISSFKSDKGTNSRYYDIDKWFDNLIDV